MTEQSEDLKMFFFSMAMAFGSSADDTKKDLLASQGDNNLQIWGVMARFQSMPKEQRMDTLAELKQGFKNMRQLLDESEDFITQKLNF